MAQAAAQRLGPEASLGRRSREVFGHPACLFTLFFAEMWERFSFYGMKALLILYLVNYLFWNQQDASDVMKWYLFAAYGTPLLGGLIADRLLGARWSVVLGGVLIAIGHFLLAFEAMACFYSGLCFVATGVGFLKPNVSTQVGTLYRMQDERRDSAFTLFYMGINSGAFLGPIICGWLRIHYGWHYGFAAAGVGMVLGLIVYIVGMGSVIRRTKQVAAEDAAAAAPGAGPPPSGATAPSARAAPAAGPLPARVRLDRCIVLVVICVFAVLFWVGFEQGANVMNRWADEHTNLFAFRATAPVAPPPASTPAPASAPDSGLGDWAMPAEWTQSFNPLFIIALAAVFAWFWQFLEKRHVQPSTPRKMAFGVFFMALAYGVLLFAVQAEGQRTRAPLPVVPAGLQVDQHNSLFSNQPEGQERYGETRLKWADGTLSMNGVLSDIDWMRSLGATSSPAYHAALEDLAQRVTARSEQVRVAKQKGEMPRDAKWAVTLTLPADAGTFNPVAGLPEKDHEPIVSWDPATRALTVSSALSPRDQAQLLAAGADPAFAGAVTSIHTQTSTLRISILWLLAFYLVLTLGELCLSPVGLSLVTKAAPPKSVGVFMGLWFLMTGGVADWLANEIAGYWGAMTPASYFMIFGLLGLAATAIMLLLLRVLKRMLHGIH